jgi:hypothetical protein
MFHCNTELLIDYWRARRGEDGLPARARIDPADFYSLLPQAFIAVGDDEGGWRFRLAGEAINDLHGRSLSGENLVLLWRPDHRRHLAGALEASLRTAAPVVLGAEARADDEAVHRLEILFAPLAGPDGRADRFLGLYQPTAPVARWARRPVRDLAIVSVDGAQARPAAPTLRLAVIDGRRIA